MNKNTQWYKSMMIRFKGDEEALKAHMKAIARKGGQATSGYGFAHGTLDARETGKMGGRPKGS